MPLVAGASVALGLVLGWAVLDRGVIEMVSTVELLGVVALAVLPVATASLWAWDGREARAEAPAARAGRSPGRHAEAERGAPAPASVRPGVSGARAEQPQAEPERPATGWRRAGRDRVRHAGPAQRATAGR